MSNWADTITGGLVSRLDDFKTGIEWKPELDYDEIFEKMIERYNMKPIIHHNCHACGGTLELREDQHIFVCPYCNSVYAVGVNQINSVI